MSTLSYPKRLIEVDLPIKRISAHAQNEKNLRSGHPWHLHIWWARRPWGACRAVALASLLPAPTDKNCPEEFIKKVCSVLSEVGFKPAGKTCDHLQDALLRFIGEFAKWELGANPAFRDTARQLVKAAYPDHTPTAFDPFSGYGAIPGEAARLGCDAIASDLNPVALLCLRTLLEAVPRHGHDLLEKFRDGVEFIRREAEKRLGEYYPKHKGKYPIAWLWARTVTCEGPGCGAEIPLISQTTIAKGSRKTWIEIKGDRRSKEVTIHVQQGKVVPSGLIKTAGGGHAVCPVCGFTTNKERVKVQGKTGKMEHRLYGVALAVGERQGKEYADCNADDQRACERAAAAWGQIRKKNPSADVTELFPLTYGLHVPPHYGIRSWGDLFSPRQKLALWTHGEILRDFRAQLLKNRASESLARDVVTALALAISNSVHYSTNMSTWLSEGMISCFIAGNAIAMRWDWAEANPLIEGYAGGVNFSFNKAEEAILATLAINNSSTTVMRANATELPLPDDSADMFFSDPPYYDVVPYADLSDLCYVWLKRFIGHLHPDLLKDTLTPKADQIVVNPYSVADGRGEQSPERYRKRMTQAFREGRRVLKPDGIGCIVFAHKGTAAWETLLASIIDAGFVVTASWPIDTERAARMRANKSAALASSVHLIVRPRETPDGSVRTDDIGDWREMLTELPRKMNYWMKRLVEEGVVGADAIFACLGPALEIYSRFSRVEKANGEQVFLKEYLEHVWGAVAREALNFIFEGADATGFEEDSRLTTMWLWTLRTDTIGVSAADEDDPSEDSETAKKPGFALEFDAANNIAKGLGIYLEKLDHLVEISGKEARLLPVAARTRYLFGKDSAEAPKGRAKKKDSQLTLNFEGELKALEKESDDWTGELKGKAGQTILDQLHQSMILFAAGRGEALKRFIVEDGIGQNPMFWRLAQSLSALYPSATDEKRWVDGVLARKKGLGF